MAARINSISGISFSSDAVCLAQFFPEGRIIANIGIQPIDDLGADIWDSVAECIKEIVKTVKLGGENVVTSLPAENAIIRRLSVDSDEPDVSEALEWELSQHIMGSREEFAFDFEELPQSSEELRAYLAVGYRVEPVQRIAKLLRLSRLNPVIVDLDVFALINVFEANYEEVQDKPAVLVFSEESRSKCVLARYGRFIDIEVIEHEQGGMTPSALSAAVVNAVSRLSACNPEHAGGNDLPVYYSGMLFGDAEFSGHLVQAVKNSELLYPFRKIRCAAGMQEDELRKYSLQLAVPVGLALRGGE